MADPLLTSLCAICHMQKPKYKCPRCKTQTCSLACVKRHKIWSECSGVRDATAYVPKALSTRARVDHDYNFLSAIERSKRQTEHDLVNNKGVVTKNELRPLTIQQVEWRYRHGQKRRVLVTRQITRDGDGDGDGDEEVEALQARLRTMNIKLVRAPVGMSLRRQDGVRYSRRTRKILWPVEWVLVSASSDRDQGNNGSSSIWGTISDHISIGTGFLQGRQSKSFATFGLASAPQPVGRARTHGRILASCTSQDASTTTWPREQTECFQSYPAGTWIQGHRTGVATLPAREQLEWLRGRVRFYLSQQPSKSASSADILVPIDPAEPLRQVLVGKVVFEHPTIYVLHKSAALPAGFTVQDCPAEARPKRKRHAQAGRGQKGKGAKRQKTGDIEEGQIVSDVDEPPEEASTKHLGSTAAQGKVKVVQTEVAEEAGNDDDVEGALSDGDIVAEMSLSEDDGDSNADSLDWESEDEGGHDLLKGVPVSEK